MKWNHTHSINASKWVTIGDTVALPCPYRDAAASIGTESSSTSRPRATYEKSWLKLANNMLEFVRSAMLRWQLWAKQYICLSSEAHAQQLRHYPKISAWNFETLSLNYICRNVELTSPTQAGHRTPFTRILALRPTFPSHWHFHGHSICSNILEHRRKGRKHTICSPGPEAWRPDLLVKIPVDVVRWPNSAVNINATASYLWVWCLRKIWMYLSSS